MNEIDQISQALGRIEANIANLTKDAGYDRTVRAEIATRLQNLEMALPPLKEAAQIVEEHERWRQRGVGIVAGLGIFASFLGWLIIQLVNKAMAAFGIGTPPSQ